MRVDEVCISSATTEISFAVSHDGRIYEAVMSQKNSYTTHLVSTKLSILLDESGEDVHDDDSRWKEIESFLQNDIQETGRLCAQYFIVNVDQDWIPVLRCLVNLAKSRTPTSPEEALESMIFEQITNQLSTF